MRVITITVLFLLCAVRSLFSQDVISDDDAFDVDAFDKQVATGAATDSLNRLDYLPGLFFVSEATGYRTRVNGATGSDARFYGKAFLKASKGDVGSLYLGYNYSWFLFAAADDNHYEQFYRVQSPNQLELRTSLSEFNFSFDVKKLVFVRVGSQLISWGATYFWTPEDFINRQKVQASVLSVVDVRSGKPGVRFHVPFKTMNLFLFTDFSRMIQNGQSGAFGENIAQAWRIDGTFSGVNIGTVGYIGRNRPEQVGFDVTGNVLGADLYGELACTFTNALATAPRYAFSIGGARTFGRERNWTLRTELYCNEEGYGNIRQSTLLPGEFTPFYSGRYYLYGEVTGTGLLGSILSMSLFGYGNLADASYSATLQGTIDLPGVLPFTIYGRYFGGRQDREFTRPFGGEALCAGMRISAAF